MTTFVAEIGSNHNGSFERACVLIREAAAAGCDAVKFQAFTLETLYAAEAQAGKASLKALELPLAWLPGLALTAHEYGLEIGCTPCYLDAVAPVAQACDFVKISSYSLLHDALLTAVAACGKPVVLGCGMATFAELWWAVEHFKGQRITLLHCRSAYPTPVDQCGLGILKDLAYTFRMRVGWSDHTAKAGVIFAALANRAEMIECHLDLDCHGAEWAGGHCWLPGQLAAMIEAARDMEAASARPTAITPAPCEVAERAWRVWDGDGLRPMPELRGATA